MITQNESIMSDSLIEKRLLQARDYRACSCKGISEASAAGATVYSGKLFTCPYRESEGVKVSHYVDVRAGFPPEMGDLCMTSK